MKKRFLIVGSGGREGAFALKLAADSVLYAVIDHKNPTITDCVKKSNGKYLIADSGDPDVVTKYAIDHKIDYVFVSADSPLANGVVDKLLENNIKAIGGTKEATRIEWDKIYSMNMVKDVCPEFVPFYKMVSREEELENAVKEFQVKGLEVVVKPQGLTGGKGVKVMPIHLPAYQDCMDYATQLLKNNQEEKVLLVEKLNGIEFTIMGITDGKNLVMSPASYDYPFRFENDTGAGTGGMGCFTSSKKTLPFMSDQDLQDCQYIIQKIINKIKVNGLFFNGVLNGGFFKTSTGIKFMEFNSRFGDPEALNILTLLDGSFADVLESIWNKSLCDDTLRFIKKASVVKYLVAREYPAISSESDIFTINKEAIKKLGVNIFFASCVENDKGQYETLKKSRVVALGAVADKIEDASDMINEAIEKYTDSDLEYRKDIGSRHHLEKLNRIREDIL